MAKQIKQFRYYGKTNTEKNQPKNITKENLKSGTIFFSQNNLTSISQLGIQTLPGTEVYINEAVEPTIIGSTGIYELDLEDFSEIIALRFGGKALDLIEEEKNGAYLIVDAIYNVEEE